MNIVDNSLRKSPFNMSAQSSKIGASIINGSDQT
jgi:hypothetical protein